VNVMANWRGRQEIGAYNTVLPEEACEAVRKLVEHSDFARHAHHANIAPDTPYTSLATTRAAKLPALRYSYRNRPHRWRKP